MAITIDDFSKIWASTSPLTPYAFSEDNYKQGWNFVGATPPSRQMWDFLQKQNDEKLKYLLDNFDNYLPLSGGNITGSLSVNGNNVITDKIATVDITPATGFEIYNNDSFFKATRTGNVVQVQGALRNTTNIVSGGNRDMGTLPVGYRPANWTPFVQQGSEINRWFMTVDENGVMNASRYGASANAQANAGTWFPFSVTFITTNAFPS